MTQTINNHKFLSDLHGEPRGVEIKKFILEQGYTEQDLLGYYFLRRHVEEKNVTKETFEKDMEWFKGKRDLNTQVTFTYDMFLKWFREKAGRDFDLNNIMDTYDEPKGSFLRTLGGKVSNFRDKNVLRLTTKYLNRGKKVMIVYGAGHLAQQRKVLEKMFGSSRDKEY